MDMLSATRIYFTVTFICTFMRSHGSDLFTSTDRLRGLSDAEDKVIPQLEEVMTSLQQRINILRSALNDIKTSHIQSGNSDLALAGHPVHAYHLIKRWRLLQEMFETYTEGADNSRQKPLIPVKQDCKNNHDNCTLWAKIGECTKNPNYMLTQCKLACKVCVLPHKEHNNDENLILLYQNVSKLSKRPLPVIADYDGSAHGLIRLQRTYKLEADDIMKGNVLGYHSTKPLQEDDYYKLGRAAVSMGEWGFGAQWLNKALQSHSRDTSFIININIQLIKAYTGMKDYEKANETLISAFGKQYMNLPQQGCYDHHYKCQEWGENGECEKNPQYMLDQCSFSCNVCKEMGKESFHGEFELKNIAYNLQKKSKRSKKDRIKDQHTAEPSLVRSKQPDWKPKYEALCRGEGQKRYHKAVCRYRPAGVAWFPFKEEILLMNPRISMVYDVINDREANLLRFKAKNKMGRAVVGSDRRTSSDRISMVGWLSDKDPFIQRLSERVEFITGLEVTQRDDYQGQHYMSSDEFQAVNYGIGGQYEPHTDYFLGEKGLNKTDIGALIKNSGDRIATFLLYLTDVKAGGGTVYPKVKIQVPPIKNAAAFWFNSRLSGDYDPLTMHAGCPVLLGEKWVCNKWVREYGNEFKRKCELKRDAKYS